MPRLAERHQMTAHEADTLLRTIRENWNHQIGMVPKADRTAMELGCDHYKAVMAALVNFQRSFNYETTLAGLKKMTITGPLQAELLNELTTLFTWLQANSYNV